MEGDGKEEGKGRKDPGFSDLVTKLIISFSFELRFFTQVRRSVTMESIKIITF